MTDSLDVVLAQLEQCADTDGSVTIIDTNQARALVEEIYTLRMGPGVSLELPGDRSMPLVPEQPYRDGQQFADRSGNVWTWTPWDQLSPADARVSGGHNMLVREGEGGVLDVALPWDQAWFEHGPLWHLPETPFSFQAALRSEVLVNGHRVQVRTEVDEIAWTTYGTDFHRHMKTDMRRRLAEKLLEELNVPVYVQRQPPWFRELGMRQRMRYVPPKAMFSPVPDGGPEEP